VADPTPRGKILVDGSGVVMQYEKPQPTSAQRILRESDRKKLEHRLARKIELAGLPAPRSEYYWAKSEGRRFHTEFAWPEQMILAEVQGGIWAADPGRHNRGAGYEADCERENLAQLLGWKVLKFTERMIGPDTVIESEAIQTLRRALQPAEKLL
jgi:very-short-patch-repair endonuclease